MSASERTSTAAAKQRKTALTLLGLVVALGLGGYFSYHAMLGGRVEQTDNAYVNANIVQITPLVTGTVRAVLVDDTDFVRAGQALVSLDPADARVALDQAAGQLAQAVREVRTLHANDATLRAQIKLREADSLRAATEVARLQADVQRRSSLLASGAVGREEFEHAGAQLDAARNTLTAAQSAVEAAREQLASNQVMTGGGELESSAAMAEQPAVQRAAARLRETYLALQRSELLAPVDGWVARRSVQLGQRVAAGAPLMAVVGLRQAWVDANFKESQVARLRIGQSATLVADVYGSKVEYSGKVLGLSAGTGAAFALLPAQNATGNWIKVVQRVPVRIALDPQQLAAHPLRVGLSMNVSVDVQDQNGPALLDRPRSEPASRTAVYDAADSAAQAEVARIIKANLGHGTAAATTKAKTRA